MKLEEVKKLFETTDYVEANTKLDDGYIILKIFSSKSKTHEVDEVKPCYVLGKAKCD